MTAPPPVTVVSLGNPYRRDDGVGAAVLDRLRAAFSDDDRVRIADLDGEPVRIMQTWEGSSIVWVVDATSSDRSPGTIHEIDLTALDVVGGGIEGGHAMGLAETVELARALDRLPPEMRVLGIEGATFDPGVGLSAPVGAAVAVAAERVAGLIRWRLGQPAAISDGP